MKKLSLLLIAIFSLLAFNYANAQNCPSGYTQIDRVITYANCSVTITFCFKCNGNNSSDVIFDQWTVNSTACQNAILNDFTNFKNYVRTYIENDAYNLCTIPPCNSQDPAQWWVTITRFPNCIKTRYLVDPTNNNQGKFVNEACHFQTHCEIITKICVDYSQNPPVVTRQTVSINQIGDPYDEFSVYFCSSSLPNFDDLEANPGTFSFCFYRPCE